MTILRKLLQSGDGHAARGWHRFGHGDQAVRYTEAWEHENFAEEQARWERSDPEYARICEQVRQARERGGEGSLRADEAKAAWDARVYTRRQANDDAQRAHHALKADPTDSRTPTGARGPRPSGGRAVPKRALGRRDWRSALVRVTTSSTSRSRSSPMTRRRPGSSPKRSACTIKPPRRSRRPASDRPHDPVSRPATRNR
jgi:hypothetical protein